MNISDVNLDKLTLENLPFQFCSDHLKGEIAKLIKANQIMNEALEVLKEMGDDYSEVKATQALAKVEDLLK